MRESADTVTDPAAAIRARRAESNAAIAARHLDGVVNVMLPDVTVAVAGGTTLIGRDANRTAFAGQFADRDFRGYVRTPDVITLHEPPARATERGRWVGTWRTGVGTSEMRGVYTAVWHLTDVGWFLASEVFE